MVRAPHTALHALRQQRHECAGTHAGERRCAVSASNLLELMSAIKWELGIDHATQLTPHYLDPDFNELVELEALDELSAEEAEHAVKLSTSAFDLRRVGDGAETQRTQRVPAEPLPSAHPPH